MSLFDTVDFNRRLFFPRRDAGPPPRGAVDSFVEVPGARLHLRVHGPAGSRVVVLLFHGNGEVVADYDEIAPLFAATGAALAVVDYRGYGLSTGEPTLRTVIEDAMLVVAAMGDRPLIVMGRSLGSAAAAALYRAPSPTTIGFIWESGLVDLDALLARRGFGAEMRPSDEERRDFDPVPKLRAGSLPLLVVHGEHDDLIAPSEGRAAFEAAGAAMREWVCVPNHGHNDLTSSPVYWQAIRAFVQERLGMHP